MRHYQCTKKVHAEPMMRKEAEKKGLTRDIKPDNHPDEEGYLVRYKNNYRSWSPKQDFDAGYTQISD